MGYALRKGGLSEQEYLAMERSSPDKHEYANGEVFAMSGGTAEHSAVILSLLAEIRAGLQGSGCRVFESNMRIHVPATGRYVYPDGAVVRGKAEFLDESRDTLVNPRVVIEVLSALTEAYDRGDKLASYRTLPSFQEYVLASQREAKIELFTRRPDGTWSLRIVGPGEQVAFTSIPCAISVDKVYEGILDGMM